MKSPQTVLESVSSDARPRTGKNMSAKIAQNPVGNFSERTAVLEATPASLSQTVADHIRGIAATALVESGGQRTYEYEATATPSPTGTGIVKVSVDSLAEAGLLRCNRTCMKTARANGTDPNAARAACTGCNDNYHPVAQAKVDILWQLLNPELDLVGRVIRAHQSRLSDPLVEILRARLTEILEQRALQNPRVSGGQTADNGLDLLRFIAETPKLDALDRPIVTNGKLQTNPIGDPVAWARALLVGSIASTTKRVFHNESAKFLTDFGTEITENADGSRGPTAVEPHLYRDVISASSSAEDMFIHADELDRIGDDAEDALENWQAQARTLRGAAKLQAAAAALHDGLGFPRLNVQLRPSVRRQLSVELETDTTLAYRSLEAFFELIAGNPTPAHQAISDDWLSIWTEYTTTDAGRVLDRDPEVAHLLAAAALALPAKPGRAALRIVQRDTIAMCAGNDAWATLIREALPCWIDAMCERDPDDVDANANAAEWLVLARRIVAWPGNPLDVASVGEAAAKIAGMFQTAKQSA